MKGNLIKPKTRKGEKMGTKQKAIALTVRLPSKEYEQMLNACQQIGVSLNCLIIFALCRYVGVIK